jgi:hypothetical protein
VCECPEGVRGSASKAWPRRERDVAATSRGHRARQGRGGGMARRGCGWASRCGCACTRAGPGFPGPRRGRAVRGAPASRARDTTRRRKATAAAAVARRGGPAGSCTRVAPRPVGRGGPKAGLRKVHRHRRQQGERRERAAVALTEGSLAGDMKRWRAEAGGSGPCRTCGFVDIIVRVPAWWRSGAWHHPPPRATSALPPILPLLLFWCGGGGRETRAARVWGERPRGLLMGLAQGLRRGPGRRGRRCPASVPRPCGAHPAAAGTGLGFAARAAGARGKRRMCVWAVTLCCCGAERAGPAGDGSGGRSVGEREKGKGRSG